MADLIGIVCPRHVTDTCDVPDLDTALSFVVQRMDGEFAEAEMPKIVIEQVLESAPSDDDGPLEWHPKWVVAVSGTFAAAAYTREA